MQKVETERLTCLVDEGYPAQRLLASLSAWPNGEVLRRTANRCVKLVRADEDASVVKWFYHGTTAGIVKTLLLGTPASREWKALVAAREEGLAAPKPLALGEANGALRRESLVVMEALENGVSLGDALFGPERLSGKDRRDALRAAACLVRDAHDLGFYQRDLHPENILIRRRDQKTEAYLLDLQRVSTGAWLTPRRRRRNLSALHGGCTEASATDRVRFLKDYLAHSTRLPLRWRDVAGPLERQGRRYRYRLWRSRQRRCVRTNREFLPVEAGSFSGSARRDRWIASLSSLLQAPERLFSLPQSRMVKDSMTTTVACAPHAGELVYIKRYNYQGAGYALKNLFRSSRGRRAWIILNSLRIRDIAAPLPLAYLEKRRRRVLFESYVIAAAVPGENLADIAKRFREGKVSLRDKRALIDELARFIRRMHDRRVAHRDLKPQNIIAEQAGAARWRMGIVDADGIRLGRVSALARDKNIARVARSFLGHPAVTRADGLRFLLAYLNAGETTRWKTLWRRLARRISFEQGKPV